MKNLMEYKGYFAKVGYSSDDDIFLGLLRELLIVSVLKVKV